MERSLLKRYFPDKPVVQPVKVNGKPSYNFLPEPDSGKTDVLYFAGCMTHLTPSIKNSMVKILEASGVRL